MHEDYDVTDGVSSDQCERGVKSIARAAKHRDEAEAAHIRKLARRAAAVNSEYEPVRCPSSGAQDGSPASVGSSDGNGGAHGFSRTGGGAPRAMAEAAHPGGPSATSGAPGAAAAVAPVLLEELAEVRRRVPRERLRACTPEAVQVVISASRARTLLLKAFFPAAYPTVPLAVELQPVGGGGGGDGGGYLGPQLLTKLQTGLEAELRRHAGGHQVLPAVQWLHDCLSQNLLAAAYDEVRQIRSMAAATETQGGGCSDGALDVDGGSRTGAAASSQATGNGSAAAGTGGQGKAAEGGAAASGVHAMQRAAAHPGDGSSCRSRSAGVGPRGGPAGEGTASGPPGGRRGGVRSSSAGGGAGGSGTGGPAAGTSTAEEAARSHGPGHATATTRAGGASTGPAPPTPPPPPPTSVDVRAVRERSGVVELRLGCCGYWLELRAVVPEGYPDEGVRLEVLGSNLPREVLGGVMVAAVDMIRRLAEPPRVSPTSWGIGAREGAGTGSAPASASASGSRRTAAMSLQSQARADALAAAAREAAAERQAARAAAAAAHEPRPSLLAAVMFLRDRCVGALGGGRCGVCGRRLLPSDPERLREVPPGMDLLQLAGCGHLVHRRCIESFLSTPPFGRDGCPVPSCGERISHHALVTDPKVLEARWAGKQARQREIEDAANILGAMGL